MQIFAYQKSCIFVDLNVSIPSCKFFRFSICFYLHQNLALFQVFFVFIWLLHTNSLLKFLLKHDFQFMYKVFKNFLSYFVQFKRLIIKMSRISWHFVHDALFIWFFEWLSYFRMVNLMFYLYEDIWKVLDNNVTHYIMVQHFSKFTQTPK
jgi:hypothetical protein